MDNARILLVSANPRERRALFKILAPTGVAIEHAGADIEAFQVGEETRLVLIDHDSLGGNAEVLLERLTRDGIPAPVIIISSSRDKEMLVDLLAHDVLTNILAKNQEIDPRELLVTAQKIVRNDLFGLEKYLSWGISPTTIEIGSSGERASAVESLTNYLHSIGCNRRLIGLAEGVADEFLTNAIYNAPVGDDGVPKYASLSRTEQVTLEDHEKVHFRYACDGRNLAVSVNDQFGRLNRETVRNYLRKCFSGGDGQIDKKQGGAGLGLYVIFESLNHFIVNLAPGSRTEMIGMIDISGTYRDFAERAKSFHMFLDEKPR